MTRKYMFQHLLTIQGHDHLNQFNIGDLTSWKKEMAELAGIPFAGPGTTHSFA